MKQLKDMDLWDAACNIDCELSLLCETVDAVDVLRESLEREGYQAEEHFDDQVAINFVRHFPVYLATLNVLTRVLKQNVESIRSENDRAFHAYHIQSGVVA